MKHFKQLTLIILTFSLLLCGCGGTQANGTNDNTENNAAQGNTNNNLIIEKDEYTLSEYISSGETIWFLTNGYGKDDKIKQIFVFEPNGTLYYCDCTWKIGEAEQKDDSEIISYVKQTYEEDMKGQINEWINKEGTMSVEEEILITDTTSIYSPYLENIESAPWKLAIFTDSTGNNTEREVVAYQEFAPLSYTDSWDCEAEITYIELTYLPAYESDKGTTNCFQVYDSWYGGYVIRELSHVSYTLNKNTRIEGYFLTRVTSNKLFNLDEVETKNIKIDDVDSLFEEILIDLEWVDAPDENY